MRLSWRNIGLCLKFYRKFCLASLTVSAYIVLEGVKRGPAAWSFIAVPGRND